MRKKAVIIFIAILAMSFTTQQTKAGFWKTIWKVWFDPDKDWTGKAPH